MLCDYLTTVRLYDCLILLKHLMGSRIVIALLYCLIIMDMFSFQPVLMRLISYPVYWKAMYPPLLLKTMLKPLYLNVWLYSNYLAVY